MRAVAIYAVYGVVCVGLFLLQARGVAAKGRSASVWPLVTAGVVALSLGMFFASEPRNPFEDFVEAYYAGGVSVLEGRAQAEELFARGVHGFVNLPILAFVFAPLALFPPDVASVVFTVAGVLACLVAWRQLVLLAGLDDEQAVTLAFLFAMNGPLMNSLREGNTSHFALAAFTGALVALRSDRQLRAGALLGAAALFKLPLLLFGVYFLARGRVRAALGGGLVVGGAGVLSILVFGFDAHVAWHERFVAHAADHPVSAFNVQSVPALVVRWVRDGGGLYDWDGYPVGSSLRRLASLPTVAFFAGATVAAVVSKGSPSRWFTVSDREREAEQLMVLVLACIASPLAWSHYYAWMLAPAAFVLARSKKLVRASVDRGLAWGAVLVVSLPVVWPPAPPGGLLERPYVLLLSHYLFGGVVLFALLCVWRWRLGRASMP